MTVSTASKDFCAKNNLAVFNTFSNLEYRMYLFRSGETPLQQRHVRVQQPGRGARVLQVAALHAAGEGGTLRHRRLLLQRGRPPRPLHGRQGCKSIDI